MRCRGQVFGLLTTCIFAIWAPLACSNTCSNHQGAVVLSFDDHFVDSWHATLPLLQKHSAHATFFISRYDSQITNESRRNQLSALAEAGHEIGHHTSNHLRATDAMAQLGLEAYVQQEVISLTHQLSTLGHQPINIAMPYGDSNEQLQRALLRRFDRVRLFGNGQLDKAQHKGDERVVHSAGIDNNGASLKDILEAMEAALESGSFLLLTAHDIQDDCEGRAYCIHRQKLAAILKHANSIELPVVSMSQMTCNDD